MPSETYQRLDKEWKATCRIILGGEIGGLDEYASWLSDWSDRFFSRKSDISGKEVVFGEGAFCSGAKIIGFDEADFSKKFEPLSLNDMKDMDSLLSAVKERIYYCGSIILGNSQFVEHSSNVTDSFYVYKSVKASGCKNVAYSQFTRLCENAFGVNEGGSTKFLIKSTAPFFSQRIFDAWACGTSSDIYCSYGLDDCRDCVFCFNLRGKSHAIGNLQLQKEKYLAIKKKLLEEMRQTLMRKKRLPLLTQIASRCENPGAEVQSLIRGRAAAKKEPQDMAKIETGFSETSKVLLNRPLPGGIGSYSGWLSRVAIVPCPAASAISGERLMTADYPCLKFLPKDRLVTKEEGLALGQASRLDEREAETISYASAHQYLGKIAYFPPERHLGSNANLIDCPWAADSVDNYMVTVAAICKHCAYSSWPRSSDHLFGCGMVYESEFCMRCHDSVRLKRCFEVDMGRGCSDTYYSHNVENLQNALFCFNTKSLRNAVGNAEVEPGRFAEVKKMLQEYVFQELSQKRDLKLDIFSVGCWED